MNRLRVAVLVLLLAGSARAEPPSAPSPSPLVYLGVNAIGAEVFLAAFDQAQKALANEGAK